MMHILSNFIFGSTLEDATISFLLQMRKLRSEKFKSLFLNFSVHQNNFNIFLRQMTEIPPSPAVFQQGHGAFWFEPKHQFFLSAQIARLCTQVT